MEPRIVCEIKVSILAQKLEEGESQAAQSRNINQHGWHDAPKQQLQENRGDQRQARRQVGSTMLAAIKTKT